MQRCAATLLVVFVACTGTSALTADDAPDFSRVGRAFLVKHCIRCHSGAKPKAELSLDVFRDSMSVVRERRKWDGVLRMLAAGDMPPEDQPQPTVADVEAFTIHVRTVFDYADRNAKPDPGRVTMRRLNRTEYRNTVRDLLWVDFDPTEAFPADDVGHGFDNIGDVLTLSPLLLERYLDAAENIANRAIVVDPPAPSRRYLKGMYLQPNNANSPKGRFRPLDPASTDPIYSGPFTASGSYLKLTPDAEMIFRATLYAETESATPVEVALFLTGTDLPKVASEEEVARFIGANVPKLGPVQILKTYEITARDANSPQEIEFPINRMAGIKSGGLALLKPTEGEPAKLHVQHLWSVGPLETRPASQIKILACSSDASPADQTREVLTRFLRRAYRRSATDAELARVTRIVEQTQADGEKWEAGIQRAIQATLCSPKFLFRVELDDRPQSPDAQPVGEFQLAARLSYFLWSTLPDDELLDLAEKQQLTASLDAQVRRMLDDPRSSELVRNFAFQWLQIQRLQQFSPDPEMFPTFNNRLRAAMFKETELFFESVMLEDRSILDLLDADYTFLNQPLAQHYGIADTNGNWIGQKLEAPKGTPIRGDAFQRVSLLGRSRGGLLTQASMLTVTSNPTRTSPVKRGRWVLEQILGAPPPPPPPDVPELVEDEQAVSGGTLRQRMEQHRKKPSCANCHARMDPIGFALENYNAIGAFRVKDGEFDIDPSGEFADGTKFSGPAEFKAMISGQQEQFTRCLTEKLLIYALGRGLEYYDRPSTERIVKAVQAKEYRFSALVTEIVKSDPFRKRRGADIPTDE